MAEGDETIVIANNVHAIPNHINKDDDVNDGVLYDKLEPPSKEVLHSLRHSPAKENHINHEDVSHQNPRLSPIKETDTETLKTVSKDIKDETDHVKLPNTDLVAHSKENEEVVVPVTHLEKENSKSALQTPQKVKKPKNQPLSESKALLDQPLELTGKRERRTIERLVMPVTSSHKKQPISLSKGLGTELGQCGEVEKRIGKAKPEELKLLHKILFGTLGQVSLLRKHIRKFNGFEFTEDSEEYKKKLEVLNKLTVANLKDICNILVIPKGSGKEDIIPRLMDYLMKPESSEKLDKKKKTGSGSSSPKKGTKGSVKESAGKKRKKGGAPPNDTIALRSDQDDSTTDEEEGQEVVEETAKEVTKKKGRPKGSTKANKKEETPEPTEESENEEVTEEEDEPSEPDDELDDDFTETSVSKKRKKATPKKKDSKVAKTPASGKKRGRAPKATPKKSNEPEDSSSSAKAKGASASAKVIYTDTEDEGGDEDQPLSETEHKQAEKKSKKKKVNKDDAKQDEKDVENETTDQTNGKDAPSPDINSYPTEEEIKGAVQDILEGADLMETTMKTVCKKVYDKYSNHDLTPKKDFIKQTVKSLIS